MKKDNLVFYILQLLMLISVVMLKNEIYICLSFLILTIILLLKYRFPSDRNYLRYNAIQIVVISIFSYFLISYGLGMVTGFTRNVFNLSIKGIIKNITVPFLIIVFEEIIRHVVAKNCYGDKRPYVTLTIVYIFLGIAMEFNGYDFCNFEVIFRFFCLVVLPNIAKESLYSYITYKVSFIPTIIMKLVFSLYIYFVPFFPNLGDYLISLLGILYPAVVYMMIFNMVKYYDKSNRYVVSVRKRYLFYPLIVFLSILVLLISGVGRYKMVAIGSGSMEPVYYRGDAVIFKKVDSFDQIKIGTIIAYEKDSVLVTHRVVEILKNKGNYEFRTKGDNNSDIDNYVIPFSTVKGIVVYKVSYIGYPTIWLNEQLGKLKKE